MSATLSNSTNNANRTNNAAYKLDVIVKAMTGIREMEAQIGLLETMQNSPDENDRPGELHIDMVDTILNAAKDMVMNQVRTLSPDDLRLLGTRTGLTGF